MSVTAQISSSLASVAGEYIQLGNSAIPVNIIVYNSSSQAVSIKTLYLTNEDDVVSLGDPVLRKRSINLGVGNNIVPPATTIEASGTIPLPSGSGDNTQWIIAPFASSSLYYLGAPPLQLGPYYENLGYWGLDYNSNPAYPLGIYTSNNNASLQIPPSLPPVVSGSPPTQQGYALNFTSSIYDYDPNVSQGALLGQLSNFSLDPPISSLANNFTYEWWSYLRSYGVPATGYVQPTNDAGYVWKTFGFPFVEGAGALIGYLESGEMFVMMEEDFVAPFPHPPVVGISSSATVPLNEWVHQAVVRNGDTVTFYINGTGSGTGTRSVALNPHYCNNYYLFGDNLSVPYFTDLGNSPYEGFISHTADGYFIQMRMSNFARYTGNFTPPTASFTASYGSGGGSVPVTSSITVQGSASYPALWIPQTDAVRYLNSSISYRVNIGGRVMIGDNPTIIVAEPATFVVGITEPEIYTLGSPITLWSFADNARPIENVGFDFQLQPTVYLKNGDSIPLPQAFNYYSSSNPNVAAVVEFSEGINSTTGSAFSSSSGIQVNTSFTQLSASGGSVIINGTGSCIIGVWDNPANYGSDPYAQVEITVVDALPVSLSVYPQIANVVSGSEYQYSAYLLKSNGSRVDVSSQASWTLNVGSDIANIDSTGKLGITGSYGNIQITAVSGGLTNSSQAVIINRTLQGF